MIKRNKVIKYYTGDEISKQHHLIEKMLVKLNQKHGKISQQLKRLLQAKKITKRVQKRVVWLSTKQSKVVAIIKRYETNLDKLDKGELIKLPPYQKIKETFGRIEYAKQNMIWGVVFILPWIFGMLVLFIPSVIQTLHWSLSTTNLTPDGMQTSYAGLKNYIFLFTEYVVDGNNVFSVSLINFMQGLVIDLPVIIIFSTIVAVLLNKKFRGHTVIKAIFFIPVIYNLAVINETLTGTFGQHIAESMRQDVSFVNQITRFFRDIGIGEGLLEIVLSAVDRIFIIVNLSGIQILIFVAAIQSIPKHLYEAADIEGATKYEIFWKITIPMITPMILTAAIYTIVDSFTRAPITRFLQTSVANGNYGLGSAISISYFVINLVIVGVVFLLFRGKVFYHDDNQ